MSFFNRKDKSGSTYTNPGDKPAQDGTKVKINTKDGPAAGTMRGGYVVPDKKKT